MNFYTDNESLSYFLHHPEMGEIAQIREHDFAEAGKHPMAPANADEAIEQYHQAMTLLGQVTAEVVAPNAEGIDHEGPHLTNGAIQYAQGTQQNFAKMMQTGLYGMTLQRQYNGLNFPRVASVMASEVIARADVGFATIWGLQDCADTIQMFATDEVKARYLPRIYKGATCSMDLTEPDAGSDLQSVRLRATYDEANACWRLNGVKRFITNGDADLHLVLARSEEGTTDGRGLSYFIFDRADGGLTVRRIENKMGIKGSPTAELVFTNAPAQLIGERRLGLIKYVMSLMNSARLGVGSQAVGLCEATCREAEAYAASRKQFGQTIDQFVAVQDMLSAMRARTDGARTLMYETARQVDRAASSKPAARLADILTPLVKLMASEFSSRNAYDCIQVHGGSGYMKEYACERLYRDARILSIYEGTSQLQVVAAIKGIANGAYLKRIEEYDQQASTLSLDDERKHLLDLLRRTTDNYRKFYEMATANGTTDARFDHCARNLTEVLAYIIMGYLLLTDSTRMERFLPSADYIIRQGLALSAGSIASME